MDELIPITVISALIIVLIVAVYAGIKRTREKSRVDYKTKSGVPYFAYPLDRFRRLTMGIALHLPVEFTLEYESWQQRLAAWFGFTRILHTGDGNFDRQVYIESDDPEFRSRLESNPDLRRAVLQLFHVGICGISALPGKLTVTVPNAKQTLDPNILDAAIEQLVKVRELLPTAALSGRHPINRLAKICNHFIFWSLGLGIAAGNLSYLEHFFIYSPFSLFKYSLQFSIAAIALFLLAIQRVFQNSSHGYRVIFNFIVFGIAACVLWSIVILYNVNVHGDASKAVVYNQKVVDKWWHRMSGRGAGVIIYNLTIDDWHDRAMSYSLEVSSAVYSRIRRGDKVRIFSHPGYLGYEWFTYEALLQ